MARHLLKVMLTDEDKRRFDEVREDMSRRYSINLSQANVLRALIRDEHQRITENELPAAANG